MTTEDRKVKISAEVDATQAREGFQAIKDGARDMAASVDGAGKSAGSAVKRIGDDATDSAQKADAAQRSILSSIRRTTSELQRTVAAANLGGDAPRSSVLEAYAAKRGADLESLRPQLAVLRDLESELSVATAREQEFAASKAFSQKAAEAAQLVKASEYVRMWEEELQKAEAAQRKLSVQTGFVDQLKRQADAIGKSRSELLEIQAAQLGVSTQAAPFIAALRQQEQSMHATGMSAGQMAMALRSVPMQFTDIVTSIAAGQSPMMVMLQQGGQLKDMFGGAGAAAQALGGYVLGLINPYTLLAAAATGVGVAYYQGSKEGDALARSIIMTGNAAGASVGQLQDMSKAVAEATKTTQGSANDAVAAAAGSGKIAAENISLVSQAAIKLNKAVGAEVSQTIDSFAELGREPVKASEKLNEKYNYLTASIYAQIKALEDQGKTLEAGALAQKAYADAMSGRSDQVIANLGLIEKAWKGITGTAKSAWDAMLGVGRQSTLSEQIAEQKKLIDAIRSGSEVGNIDVAQKHLAALEAMATSQGKVAAAAAETGRQEQARIAWLKEGDRYLSKAEERERAITKARAEGLAAGASEAEIAKRIAAIREKMADPKTPKSQGTKDLEEFERVLGRISEKSADLDSGFFKDLNVLFKGFGDGRFGAGATGVEKYRDAVERLIKTQKFYTDAEKLWLKQQQDGAKALAATAEEGNKLQDKLDALRTEQDAYGKTESAVYRMLAARADERVEMNRFGDANDEMIGQLRRQRDIYLELADAKTRSEQVTDARKALDQLPGLESKFDLKIDTSSLKNAFSGLGGDIGNVIDKLRLMTDVQANFGKQAELIAKAKRGTSAQYAEAVQYEIELNKKMLQASIGGYADIIGAAKGFVSERSRGYKALEAAEKAFRLVQLGMAVTNAAKEIGLVMGVTAAKVAGDQAATASTVQSAAVQATATMAAGSANATLAVTNQAAKGDPYSAWVRMAAMAAAMAALGFAVSGAGGGSGPNPASAAEMQARQGTGTVLGDASAKSQSIAKALESLSDIDQLTMRYSAQMAASLRNIENSFAGLSSIVVRTYGLTTGNLTGVQTGTTTQTFGESMGALGFMDRLTEKALSQLPVVGDLAKGLFNAFGSVKVKLIDSGVQFDQGTIADYIAGLGMSQYGTLETTKKSWFGLSKNVSTSVVNDELSAELTRQFSLVFSSLDATLITASQALGVSTSDISDKVNAFQLEMQRLSLKGMNGAEVQEALGNYFSAIFDKVSGSVLPGLEDWQKVGEGYYETLIRVATGADQARYYTEQLGITMAGLGDVATTQGDAAAELLRASITMAQGQSSISQIITGFDGTAEEISNLYTELLGVQDVLQTITTSSAEVSGELIRTAGGFDKLKDELSSYYEGYFSESERSAKSLSGIADQFAALGLRIPDSKAAFRAIVEGIDLSTAAGQKQLAVMMSVADSFSEIQGQYESWKSSITGGFDASIRNVRLSVLDKQGQYDFVDKEAAKYRDILAGLTDPAAVAEYADRLRGSIDQAWGLLTEDQQKASADEFIKRYEAANALASDRLDAAREQAIADRKTANDGITLAIAQGIAAGADSLAAAAAAVPDSITLDVNDTSSLSRLGITVSAEVGYSN